MLLVAPAPVVPLADEPDGAVDDPVLPLIDPPVDPTDEPVALVPDGLAAPPLTELDAPLPVLDVLGDADGAWLPATPAACIDCR